MKCFISHFKEFVFLRNKILGNTREPLKHLEWSSDLIIFLF